MAYSEKYPVKDMFGYTRILCVDHRFNKDLNDGAGGYEDVIAIRHPQDFRSDYK